MLRASGLICRSFSLTYYPFLISPDYELAEYSPVYLEEARKMKIESANIDQIDAERLPQFLSKQISKDRQQFVKEKEILFMGRSNAGKSSLINSILRQKKIARSAKDPGTTKFLHFHQVKIKGQKALFVDAPGFGFAKMNKRRRDMWFGLVDQYLKISSRLCQIFHVINFEHGVKDNDIKALTRVSSYNVDIQLVLNKVDKVPQKRYLAQVKSINEAVRRLELPNINNRIIACSTKTGFGIQFLQCRVIQALANSPQRSIDQHEQLLLQYLKNTRVSPVQLNPQQKTLTRPHVVRKLLYDSKLTKFLA